MAVVVTGGYGHIGTWVVKKLAEEDNEIIIFNRSRRNIDFLEEYESQIKFFKGDVLDVPSIFRMFKEHDGSIDGIIHIAGLMGGPFFPTNPHLHTSINTMGSINFFEAARIYNVKKFVYISSGSVYGDRNTSPKESDPVNPSELYGAVKASTELIGFQYANEFGLDFRSIRVFFAYGPGRLPSELYGLYQAIFGGLENLASKKLDAGLDQEIDFTYVGDVAKAILMLYKASKTKYRAYNIASGQAHKIPDVIKLANKYSTNPIDVEMGPGKIMPRGPSLDIARISSEFGYKSDYDIEKGIAAYAEWIKNQK